jgi:hypothetical protein
MGRWIRWRTTWEQLAEDEVLGEDLRAYAKGALEAMEDADKETC